MNSTPIAIKFLQYTQSVICLWRRNSAYVRRNCRCHAQ